MPGGVPLSQLPSPRRRSRRRRPRAKQVTRADERTPARSAAPRLRLPGEGGANNQVAASFASSASSRSLRERRNH
eukprot:7613432-Pyramimonas_sp.AAC.1